jgi:hypothetical protein
MSLFVRVGKNVVAGRQSSAPGRLALAMCGSRLPLAVNFENLIVLDIRLIFANNERHGDYTQATRSV